MRVAALLQSSGIAPALVGAMTPAGMLLPCPTLLSACSPAPQHSTSASRKASVQYPRVAAHHGRRDGHGNAGGSLRLRVRLDRWHHELQRAQRRDGRVDRRQRKLQQAQGRGHRQRERQVVARLCVSAWCARAWPPRVIVMPRQWRRGVQHARAMSACGRCRRLYAPRAGRRLVSVSRTTWRRNARPARGAHFCVH